jgi:hypothetical protein
MKKLIAPVLIGAVFSSFAMAGDMDMKAEIEALKAQMKELKDAQKKINIASFKKQFYEVKAHDAHDNIKFSADLRTSYDVIDYKINKSANRSNGIWTNKFTLKMAAQPRNDLVFHGALGVYKAFGSNMSASMNGFQNMDWYADETPSGDANFRLKEAYFIYFGKAGNVPYTVSFGRRPAINGFLTNYRDDDAHPASPLGHNINMEFDGASFLARTEDLVGLPGSYFKICIGRGNSNADAKYPAYTGYPVMTAVHPSVTQTPYVKNNWDSPNMDLAGILMKLYDDGQYTAMFNWFKGWNMMGANFSYANGTNPSNGYMTNLVDVGDLTGGALSFQISGIGDGINDFLDDTNFFASFAWSKTDPKGKHNVVNPNTGAIYSDKEMLGSSKSETGTSYYVGVNFPCMLVDGARWGLEYNHGSKYWRSFTYGEDTLVGSKLATRGNAYEIFYDLPLLDKFLTAQFRYTYIDYDYTGSDMFFGSTGTPYDVDTTPGAVKSASDLRLSIRYRY